MSSNKQLTVEDLVEALKQYPNEAVVFGEGRPVVGVIPAEDGSVTLMLKEINPEDWKVLKSV